MLATKNDVYSMIESMSEVDFSQLCIYLDSFFDKANKKKIAEERFVSEVKAAEESVAKGNYVNLSQLHDNLGV